MRPDPASICLFGAAPGLSNLGVEALCRSTLAGIAARLPDASFSVFDYRRRRPRWDATPGGPAHVSIYGANHSRRLWRGDTLRSMRTLGRLDGHGLRWLGDVASPGLAAIRRADVVLDLSGGDSFTDLYGRHRFDAVSLPKWIALEQDKPLVLLPQTYGPFRDAAMRAEAADIVRRARAAWARDARSYEVLVALLGDELDPRRHRLGVDMAFGLEARGRVGGLDPVIERWHSARPGPVVGVNVSGLIWSSPERAQSYGFRADYRALTVGIVRRLLAVDDVHVALVPHVLAPIGSHESDLEACLGVEAAVGAGERLRVLRPPYGASEIKHEIGRLDWFLGTRMHATIAALSTGVPASAIAYSPKFLGVFERCGLGGEVVDPTQLDEEQAIERAMGAFHARTDARTRLAAALPAIRATLAEQLDDVVAVVRERRGSVAQDPVADPRS